MFESEESKNISYSPVKNILQMFGNTASGKLFHSEKKK